MMSLTLSSALPSLPPGCSTWKSSAEKPRALQQRHRERIAERQHHRRRGGRREAERAGLRRRRAGPARRRRPGRGSIASRPTMAISGMSKRLAWATRSSSSGVSPELDSASTASVARDHAEVAVAGLGRMDELRRRAGRGQGRGDLARDMAALAHAGDDDPAAALAGADLRQAVDRRRERAVERLGQRADAVGLEGEDADRGRTGWVGSGGWG